MEIQRSMRGTIPSVYNEFFACRAIQPAADRVFKSIPYTLHAPDAPKDHRRSSRTGVNRCEQRYVGTGIENHRGLGIAHVVLLRQVGDGTRDVVEE